MESYKNILDTILESYMQEDIDKEDAIKSIEELIELVASIRLAKAQKTISIKESPPFLEWSTAELF